MVSSRLGCDVEESKAMRMGMSGGCGAGYGGESSCFAGGTLAGVYGLVGIWIGVSRAGLCPMAWAGIN